MKHLAREIGRAFLSETTSTYYIPYTRADGQKQYAKEKLYDRYKNVREHVRSDGIIQRKRKKQTSSVAALPGHGGSSLNMTCGVERGELDTADPGLETMTLTYDHINYLNQIRTLGRAEPATG
ncbi:unnamed protein product [Bemisia tabaci]|uniref:Uncharacterized protein n=1 Tax=Bemisia tabaci TaxID=7038 RepID=A0A9P0AE63_BEMTA|nr:unnamed protein product [Bemisia tabaci]